MSCRTRRAIENGEPVIYQLVQEEERAWHAGVSEWQGTTELNAASIGIENVNLGPSIRPQGRTWQPYPPAQVDALVRLAKDIVTRYRIPPTRVVGHSDVAPQRKIDPGPLFPWRTLYEAGVGAWPDDADVARHLAGRDPKAPADVKALQDKLRRYGYAVATDGVLDEKTRHVFSAFQMHFRPARPCGRPGRRKRRDRRRAARQVFPAPEPTPRWPTLLPAARAAHGLRGAEHRGLLLRWLWMLRDSPLCTSARRRSRRTSSIRRSLLSALVLVAIIGFGRECGVAFGEDRGLVVYIVLGAFALKRGRTKAARAVFGVLAIVTFAFIASVARSHDPLGFLRACLA